jgi:tRNA-dihydrouridine synthase B
MKTIMSEQPCGIQIFGTDPDQMCAISQYAEENGASFIDINCGCPVPKVTKSGAGSAMLIQPNKMVPILEKLRKSITIPLSLKIRMGWDENNITAHEISHIAYESGCNWLSIHGRTKNQGYSGTSNWDFIKSLTNQAKLPIVGNGDIYDEHFANKLIEENHCQHLMIGRRLLTDPIFFLKIKHKITNKTIQSFIERFHDLTLEYTHPKIQAIKLKKIYIYLSFGWINQKGFQKSIYQCPDTPEIIKDCALGFFAKSNLDPSYQYKNFLKGGHG